MLKLKEIKKQYLSQSDKVDALKGVSLNFRKSEFVSILGPSGCGKTTLLNIIGGLDHYSSGDLIINGRSTKDFNDHDWDSYRNHSIGFVFQSYNLIPHQSVLANVELALTLSGVSKAERRKKAIQALEKVGLSDQIKKRPNQLSGGQMQRVAIARALVNDPDILLADEPTGALDSVTSIQIMELLKEVSKEKLVIMVTHNPDLAEEYSTRIIRLLDGRVTDDTNPFEGEADQKAVTKKEKKPSMSIFTAFSLSLNNLMTKKGRTILTSFAGSIGIIGIALILAISNGINAYINSVQEESLSGYPIEIQAESLDMATLMTTLMGIEEDDAASHGLDAVYSSKIMHKMINTLNGANVQTNNLKKFKTWLDANEEIRQYATNIQYSYDLNMQVYTKNADGKIVKSNMDEILTEVMVGMGMSSEMLSGMSGNSTMTMSMGSVDLWQEMLPDENGKGISPLMKEQYDMIYGSWPTSANEMVLVVNERNEISDMVLCALGLKSTEEVAQEIRDSQSGKELNTEVESWSYEELCGKEFKVFLPYELYQENTADGSYTLLTEMEKGTEYLYQSDKGIPLRISGIIRLKEDVNAGLMSATLGYTIELTELLLDKNEGSILIDKQRENPTVDVITGLPFLPEDYVEPSDEEKILAFTQYYQTLTPSQKAELYRQILMTPSEDYVNSTVDGMLREMDRETLVQNIIQSLTENTESGMDVSYIEEYIKGMSDEELFAEAREGMKEVVRQQYAQGVAQAIASIPEEQLTQLMEMAMASSPLTEDAPEIPGQNPGGFSFPTAFTQKELVSYHTLFTPPHPFRQ